MARTAITVTQVTRSGVVPPSVTAGDTANDHSVAGNDGLVWIEAKNTGAATGTVYVATPGTQDGLAVADLAVAVGATVTKLIGPFPPSIYNQSDGALHVDLDGVGSSSWEFRAYRL